MAPIGFFGKMPAHGDFVRRDLPGAIAEAWDPWLSGLMGAAREALGGDAWLDVYLTSPVWRFAFGPDVAGPAQTGVLVPSVDRVGRYFPLVLVLPVEAPAPSVPTMARAGDALLSRLESLALRALRDDTLNADALSTELATLDWSWPDPPAPLGELDEGVCLPLADTRAGAAVSALARLLEPAGPGSNAGGTILWWSDGSDRVAPCVLRTVGLPRATAAVAMLDGEWPLHGWSGGPDAQTPGADESVHAVSA